MALGPGTRRRVRAPPSTPELTPPAGPPRRPPSRHDAHAAITPAPNHARPLAKSPRDPPPPRLRHRERRRPPRCPAQPPQTAPPLDSCTIRVNSPQPASAAPSGRPPASPRPPASTTTRRSTSFATRSRRRSCAAAPTSFIVADLLGHARSRRPADTPAERRRPHTELSTSSSSTNSRDQGRIGGLLHLLGLCWRYP
jgi:hypothetical protein